MTKDTSCINKITPKMNKPIYQQSTEKHQAGSLVAEYILNMIMISVRFNPTTKEPTKYQQQNTTQKDGGRGQKGGEGSGKEKQ